MNIENDNSKNVIASDTEPDLLLHENLPSSVDNEQLIIDRNNLPKNSGNKRSSDAATTHWKLLRKNRSYRLFATSYALAQAGEYVYGFLLELLDE
jgi:hypothetical protein